MSTLFPEKDKGIVQRVLREGFNIVEPGEDYKEVIKYLSDHGLILIERIKLLRCTNKNDEDFLDRDVLDCPGLIPVIGKDLYCPDCGRPIGDIAKKESFERWRASINPEGINAYIGESFGSLENVEEVEQISPFVFNILQTRGSSFTLVIPPFAGVRYLSSGLFFSEPTLYILPSHIYKESRTVVEEAQYMELADLVSESQKFINERVDLAAIPIEGRRDLSDIENLFDDMLERHGERYWQFFEQEFIPAFVNHLVQNPDSAQKYLEKLQRLDGTIFGEFYVPIGGAGRPDLRSIKKFEMMNNVIGGNAIGDAKCHRESVLTYDHIETINLHLDKDPNADKAIIILANEKISSTAWDTVLDLRRRDGTWKIVIITKYLLLELINALEADKLLEL
ncbi:MAG: hypothetical protein ACXAB4_01920 [Candidatus Hodarchaeales archaeon]|jgi:hypothetical protein